MLKNLNQDKNSLGDLNSFLDKYINYDENKKYFYTIALASPFLFNFIKNNPDVISFILKHLKNTYSKVDYLEYFSEVPPQDYFSFYLKNLIRIFIKDFHNISPKWEAWKEHSFLIDAFILKLYENFKEKYKNQENIFSLLDNVFILGMGKLASLEINYRSDIDLIFIFNGNIEKKDRIFFDNLIKEFLNLLENYFLVDTRLRPFGTKGPLIISLEDFENYLYKYARPWEKIAYFRSRILLGPKDKINNLRTLIQNFVFSSLGSIKDEIIKLKNLLLEHKEKLDLINIKEGKGGIRYIEFIAQGLALIFSKGLNKEKIFSKDTISLLEILKEKGILLREEADFLKEAYIFFRDIEHLLQIKDFKPKYSFHLESEDVERISKVLNLSKEEFKEKLISYRKKVSEIFKRYFEDTDKIYFSSLTKRKLKLLGFKNYENLFEKYKNIISSKNFLKESFEKIDALFQNILPYILEGKYSDVKFKNFLNFIQDPFFLNYLYQVKNEPLALKIFTYIFEADYFSEILLKYKDFVEEIFKIDFLNPNYKFLDLLKIIENLSVEEIKKYKNYFELSFYLGYKLGNIDIKQLAEYISLLAHVNIYNLAKKLEIPFSIYALGKLGGYELLYFGDLDLIFVAHSLEEKNKSLNLASKLVNNLENLEYEVDLRLRPYGNQSEIVVPITYYKKYFEKIGRLWERLAYTKSKDIYKKYLEFENIIKNFIFKKDLDKNDLNEILNLLNKLIETYSKEDPIKYSKGGLISLEFVSFTYQLFYKFKEPNLYKVLEFLKLETNFDFTKDYIFLKTLELEKKIQKNNFYLSEKEEKKLKEIEKKVEEYFSFLDKKLS